MSEPAKVDLSALRQYCLSLLARRDYSAYELNQKLAAKGATSEQIAAILTMCHDKGWQSDVRFAENYTQYRSNRGVGPRKLAYELQRRGIDAPLIEDAMAEGEWIEKAKQARVKRFGAALPTSMQDRTKQMRFLMQRGFTMQTIKTVLTESVEYENDSQ